MKHVWFLLCIVTVIAAWSVVGATAPAPVGATAPRVVSVGTRPESVTRGFGGRYFVTVMNGTAPGDGVVRVIDGDEVKDFATGFDEPKGICFTGKYLVTTDIRRVFRIDSKGEKTVLADEKDFPLPVSYLNDAALEPGGKAVYVTDMGANTKMRDPQGTLWPLDSPQAKEIPVIGRLYRITVDGKVTLAVDASPEMLNPNGVSVPQTGRLLVAEFFQGNLLEIKGKKSVVLNTGFRGADGVEQDRKGNLYVSSWTQGKVWKLDRRGKNETVLTEGLQSAADFFLDDKAGLLLVPDMKAGSILFLPLSAK